MIPVERDQLFVALTRPQIFARVTYTFFVINAVLAAELFLIFKWLWVLVPALILHEGSVLLPEGTVDYRYLVDPFTPLRAR